MGQAVVLPTVQLMGIIEVAVAWNRVYLDDVFGRHNQTGRLI
jgi:hypothetical protein